MGEPFPDKGSPISRALRVLGVNRGVITRDEFEAVDLQRHRATEAGRMTGAILDAVRTEWLKVRTLSGTAALCAAAAVVTVAMSTLVAAAIHISSADPGGRDPPSWP